MKKGIENEVITEEPEEQEQLSMKKDCTVYTASKEEQSIDKYKVIEMYKQIDQMPLLKINVPKAELSEEAIP